HLLSLRRTRLSGKKSRNTASGRLTASSSYVQIYLSNGQMTSTQIDFPAPNAYLDQQGINLLRNAYEIYKRDDLLSDLFAYYRSRSETSASAQDRLDSQIVLNALDWWEDDKEGATEALKKAVELAGGDSELSLSLAALYERQGEPIEAMAVI